MDRINRFKRHWQTLPARNRVGAALCLMALLAIIVTLVVQIGNLAADIASRSPPPKQTPDTTHDPAPATTLALAEIRGRVWNKAEPLMEQAGS